MKNIILLTLVMLLCGCGSMQEQKEAERNDDFWTEEAEKAAPVLEKVSRDVADEIEIGAKVKEIVRKQEARNTKHAQKEQKKEEKKQKIQSADEKKPKSVKETQEITEPRQKDIFCGYDPIAIMFGIIVVLSVALVSSLFLRRKRQ